MEPSFRVSGSLPSSLEIDTFFGRRIRPKRNPSSFVRSKGNSLSQYSAGFVKSKRTAASGKAAGTGSWAMKRSQFSFRAQGKRIRLGESFLCSGEEITEDFPRFEALFSSSDGLVGYFRYSSGVYRAFIVEEKTPSSGRRCIRVKSIFRVSGAGTLLFINSLWFCYLV